MFIGSASGVLPKNRFLLLAQRILLLLLFYTISRLLFLIFNFSYFKGESVDSFLKLFFFGLRFDITAIVISNILFITLSILPFRFFYGKAYQSMLRFLFVIVNSFAFLFNCIDLEFFKFEGRRATADAFRIMSFGEDFINTAPGMIRDFWYVLLIFIILVIVFVFTYNKIKISGRQTAIVQQSAFSTWYGQTILTTITFILCFIGFRGGVQFRPINIMTASQYASGPDVALVLNTPFTVLKTVGKSVVTQLSYFPKEEAIRIAPVIHHSHTALPFRQMNVVLVIVESMGNEYIGSANNYKGYTPFIDSLSKKSLVFTQAFANGKRSIEGIPGVIAGLPALMTEPFITSAYNGNKITGIASILKNKGYKSLFFHGGTNGTMGFDNFTRLADYDAYYGRKEYNNDNDFDNSWGIYDEPFLQYAAQKINGTGTPFFATVFTLSSHHPYTVPEEHKGKFSKGTLPIHESIQYADYSLSKFFETVSHMPWFKNTLFVITADHTALSEFPFYQNHVGLYSIPLIYFAPGDSLTGINETTAQQIDIIPSILDYLHYDKSYFSFGTSVFDSVSNDLGKHFAVNSINDTYQIISDGYALTMDTVRSKSLYHYRSDSLLTKNLLDSLPEQRAKLERKLKAFLQNYNAAMLGNNMSAQ